MKLFYALFILIQLIIAFLSHDQNRIAYLMYLWSIHGEGKSSSGNREESFLSTSDYKETKT